jgi:hypothetical protein
MERSRNEMYSDDNCICEGEKINPECPRHGDNKWDVQLKGVI